VYWANETPNARDISAVRYAFHRRLEQFFIEATVTGTPYVTTFGDYNTLYINILFSDGD
jgi:hypothetical protein